MGSDSSDGMLLALMFDGAGELLFSLKNFR